MRNDESDGVVSATESYLSMSARIAANQTSNGSPARSDRPAVKRSVIGANTIVGLRARITNSVIMDNCIIGPGYFIYLLPFCFFE